MHEVNYTDDVFVTVLRDRQPKVVISNCGVITRSNRSIGRRLPDVGFGTMQRPQVIDEYENYKGMWVSKVSIQS